MVVLFWELMLEVCCWGIRKEKLKWTIQQWIWNPNYRSYLTWDHFILASIHSTNHNALLVCRNVLKSATLLSATPECHSRNRERRRSATPFFIKRRDVRVALIFLRRAKIWAALFFHSFFSTIFFFLTFFFSK